MCGICGTVGIESTERSEAITRRMMGAIRHRGPDDEGLFLAPSVALGMRRLSIVDLAGGRQPVFNEARNVAVVFNGMIYNYRDLRSRLLVYGHEFRTQSDTEVIVHAYEQWGESCLEELRGMFAFAVWDGRETRATGEAARNAKVFIARDRLGIKPLYYSIVDGSFMFASEVRALLASGGVTPRISPSSLEAYLLFGCVAEPSTMIDGVYSLLPGHSITLTTPLTALEAHPKRYWNYAESAIRPSGAPPKTFDDAARQLRPLLEQTVRDHLIADVPLGVFLSSGLDSTALVALASQSQSDLRTFTVVFPQQEFCEGKVARETARHFKTRHEETLLTLDQVVTRLDDAVGALDQPTMDGLNTYFVSWAAHQAGLKVALSGLGGDEIFGGYTTFKSTPRAVVAAGAAQWIPGPIRHLAAEMLTRFSSRDATRKAAAAWGSPDELPHAYYFTRTLFTPSQVGELLEPGVQHGMLHIGGQETRNPWRERMEGITQQADRLDSFAKVSCFELQSYTSNMLLRDTDAVSMANALEVRVPLLDHKLVEFVAQLPLTAKRLAPPKALLMESLDDLLPAQVTRQAKRTFTLPWEVWLRGSLGERVSEELANLTPPLQQYVNQRAVDDVWRNFKTGRTSWSRPWSLYVLNDWIKRHVTEAAVHESSTAIPVRATAVAVNATNTPH
jgi:asparagine synthase (glutamine-hydrolysing)